MITWAIMKIISYKLWLPNHTFPSIPFLSLPSFVQIALQASFFVITFLLLIKPLNRWLLLCLLLTETLSMLGDQLRWQPWVYQFLFILFSVFINHKKPKFAINNIILILASTYFFSGLQKINSGFLQNVWLRLVLVRFLHLPSTVYSSRILRYAGLIVPLIETATGILLLLPKQHKFYALLPMGIHLFVLVFLSPLGIHFNAVVIPWNVAMAAFIWILFLQNHSVFLFSLLLRGSNIVVGFAWMLLPIAGMLGYWDRYFSSSVYSGNSPYLLIYIADTASVPPELRTYLSYSKKGFQGLHTYINVNSWSLSELQVPVPPERRIHATIEQEFEKKYGVVKPVFYYR